MSKRLDAIEKKIDELYAIKLNAGRIMSNQIDVKIGTEEKEVFNQFYGNYYKEYIDIVVDLQEVIYRILDHCKLSMKFTALIPKKLVVEKKKDGTPPVA